MKKILLLTCLIIFIPYIIVSLFIKEENIKFKYSSNMVVRVKKTDSEEVIKIPFEDYIVGVLAGEMPISFEIEALKAQAVAARSYVMKKMEYNKDKVYDVVDTVLNQVYLDDEHLRTVWKDDYNNNINKIKKAVLETHNEYLEYDGKVVDAMFFSTSVGFTENSEEVFPNEVPYLRSVESKWDEISPVYEVNYNFDLKDFYQKLDLDYNDKVNLEVIDKTSTGRIKKIKINNKLFDGSEVVNKLELRSNHFTINQNNDKVHIVTKGYGHGVGMSQYGAQGMALEGYKYDEILKHYYQDVKIKKF